MDESLCRQHRDLQIAFAQIIPMILMTACMQFVSQKACLRTATRVNQFAY